MIRTNTQTLTVGLRRHPWRFVVTIFLSYSALWTVLESSAFFLGGTRLEGLYPFLGMLAASILIGVLRALQPRRIQLHLKTTDTFIELCFGDLFNYSGCKVIPVNEFFDSQLGDPVAPGSVHGQFISRFFGPHPASLDALVDRSLETLTPTIVSRQAGRTNKYPIGTTAVVPVYNDKYFLLALTHTDIQTFKASADVTTLWEALGSLWNQVRNSAGGEEVTLPLIGGGISDIGLPPTQLLQLIIISIVDFTRRHHIVSRLRIVLPESRFEDIDLEPIRNEWR